jgi:uncharacterized protein YdeI (YjbR/CyaY-like superfamily)
MRYGGVVRLGVHKATMEAASTRHGDQVTAEMEVDESRRVVDVPEALQRALDADPKARAKFDTLAFTHRNEFARWVAEAEKYETRARRVRETLDRVKAGMKPR